jgi:hypothetical protein
MQVYTLSETHVDDRSLRMTFNVIRPPTWEMMATRMVCSHCLSAKVTVTLTMIANLGFLAFK